MRSLHRVGCDGLCGGGIPVRDPIPQVPFDREAWQREFARLNPGRNDVTFREYDGCGIVEFKGKPPVMPAMTEDGRVLENHSNAG